jgi:mannose-6-phosphate isomerase-like protein (cupin superfamily)
MSARPAKPIILRKNQVEPYTNPGGRNQICWDIVPRTLNPRLAIGFNSMRGDSCNGVGIHDTWDQVFIVTAGRGTLISGTNRIPIEAGCIVFIPKSTPHDVETTADQSIDYYYVNVYDNDEIPQ